MCDVANKRIDELIKKSGSPIMIVKGDSKTADQHIIEIEEEVERYEDQHDGEWITGEHSLEYALKEDVKKLFDENKSLVNLIDRMEVALSNVLNEREQLMKDLHRIYGSVSCQFCKHENKRDAKCDVCTIENDHWEWRGIPDRI